MDGLELREVTEEEFAAYSGVIRRAFGFEPLDSGELELYRAAAELDRSLAVFDGAEMVATAGIQTMEMTVPGGQVAMAGVTRVAVDSAHRRRGLLTRMMRRQMADVRERGEPLAGLYASEGAIYGRYGYGPAIASAGLEIERHRAVFQSGPPAGGRVRMAEPEVAAGVLAAVWDRFRREQAGAIAVAPPAWRLRLADLPSSRRGASSLYCALHQDAAGATDGYATYRLRPAWDDSGPRHELSVQELVATTAAGYAALWRHCLSVDLVGRVTAWARPVDEPLPLMLADPRSVRRSLRDGVWLRLVDVGAALAARTYAAPGGLVLEVSDGFCDWNRGRYELQGGPEGATCRRTGKRPDLSLGAADLATAFLGGTSFSRLVHAWRASEHRAGAAARADAMFRVEPAAWCPTHF